MEIESLENLNNQDDILNQEEIIEIEESDLAFESDEEKPSINNKKGVKLHTIKSKIKIAKYAKSNTIKEAVLKFNIPRTTINDWIKNLNKYSSLDTSKLEKTTMHKGKPPLNPDIENKLISFIEFNRRLYNPITTYSLYLKLLELWPERKKYSQNTNYALIYRILIRHSYTFRTKSHYGQLLKKEAFKDASLFLNEIRNNRINNGINSSIIGNMDETPIFFNMPISKTIIKKGAKQVIIRTQGQEKLRVSVILSILADGDKLPPLIIFKAKDKGTVYKHLNEEPEVKSGKCFIECNSNAWATEEIIDRWFTKIWLKYLKSDDLFYDNLGYLILDKATSHVTDNIIAKYKNDNNFLTFIPSGLTRYLQPLDVVINKPFKEALKKLYVEYCIENEAENSPVSRKKILEMITKVWWDENIITKEMIYKSFRVTGIANSLNGEEDYLFSAWSKMQEERPLVENNIDEYIEDDFMDSDLEDP